MNILPIVERELRVRARQGMMFWARFMFVVVALLVCLIQLSIGRLVGGANQSGESAFWVLVAIAFALSVSSCLLTADLISVERRENTLGLLAATRISANDILWGKLLSAGALMICGLLAILPIIALPLLLGGVKGNEVFQSSLVILNTLFLSLATGLFASVRHREWYQALRAALVGMLLLLLMPLTLEWFLFPRQTIGLLSPVAGLFAAGSANNWAFWVSIGIGQWLAWGLLLRTSRQLRLTIHNPDRIPIAKARQESAAHRISFRAGAIGDEPMSWLFRRQQGVRGVVWIAIGLMLLVQFLWLVLRFVGVTNTASYFWWPVSLAGSWISCSLLAWVASQFFFQARHSGGLEVLVTTPIASKDLIRHHWTYWKQLLRWPVGLFVLVMILQSLGRIPMAAYVESPVFLLMAALNSLRVLVSFAAIGWVGMWFGLRSRTQVLAVLKMVLWIEVFPQLFGMLVNLLLSVALSRIPIVRSMVVLEMLYSVLPSVVITGYLLGLLWWVRKSLLAQTRLAEVAELKVGENSNLIVKAMADGLCKLRHWTPA